MELIFRICLFITGIINLLPFIIAFLPEKIVTSYGIVVPDQNYELLLRHRAVLFGIIGGIMIHAAIGQRNYALAVGVGLVSMVSYLILAYLVEGEINTELSRVAKIDVGAVVILVVGYGLYLWQKS